MEALRNKEALQAIASSSSLVVLKLDENNLGTEGAEALAEALSRNTTLEELHVSNTSIGDEGEHVSL